MARFVIFGMGEATPALLLMKWVSVAVGVRRFQLDWDCEWKISTCP